MKKIFNNSKLGIAVILTLCILIGIAGTCFSVTAMAAETTATVEETAVATEEITTVVVEESTTSTEDTTVVTEENTQELMPMMASRCNDYWAGQPSNAKLVSASYLTQNGVDPHSLKYDVLGAGANISSYNIYKDSNGGLWLYSGSGSYIPTYVSI